MSAVEGPLISHPGAWVVVFDPMATNWLARIIPGRFKHVRAFGYVPFLHVWIFYDANFAGIEIIIAKDGADSHEMIRLWSTGCECVLMPRRPHANESTAVSLSGWCVPAVARLIGLPCGALRPDGFLAHCLRNGGKSLNEQQRAIDAPADAAGGQRTVADIHPSAR
jgi:hypothetical protein